MVKKEEEEEINYLLITIEIVNGIGCMFMKLEYIIFILFFIPWGKGIFKYIKNKTPADEKAENKKKQSPEKHTLIAGCFMVASSIPYIGAYFYADLKYIWIIIGGLYVVLGFITLVVGYMSIKLSKQKYFVRQKETAKDEYKNVDFWPKWQIKVLCGYQVLILVFWLYSWRHLI